MNANNFDSEFVDVEQVIKYELELMPKSLNHDECQAIDLELKQTAGAENSMTFKY